VRFCLAKTHSGRRALVGAARGSIPVVPVSGSYASGAPPSPP
jgi:hypothetical protein